MSEPHDTNGTPPDPDLPATAGGTGGGYVLPGKGLKDARLEARSLKRRWPISEEVKEAMLRRQATIALDRESSRREATQAFRAVLAAEEQNMEDEKTARGGETLNVNLVKHEQLDDAARGEALDQLYARLGRRAGSAPVNGQRNGDG